MTGQGTGPGGRLHPQEGMCGRQPMGDSPSSRMLPLLSCSLSLPLGAVHATEKDPCLSNRMPSIRDPSLPVITSPGQRDS